MERSNYILKNIDNNQYSFIVISKDMSRLQEYISNVEHDLQLHHKKNFVLFDLLLNNSIEDRFYKCYFDGKKLNRNTLKKVNPVDLNSNIIATASKFYLKNECLLEDMFFTNEYKKEIISILEKQVNI